MGKRDVDFYEVSETGNWNVAAEYSRLKIMKPLDNCDHYENIAKFGYDSILEQINYNGIPTEELKILGFERLVHELLKLINNCSFAMKKPGTATKLEEFKVKLENILNVMPKIYEIKRINNKRSLVINGENYNKVLKIVLKIKSEINNPLNQNHLIFTDKEVFDPQAYKEQIKKSAKERG